VGVDNLFMSNVSRKTLEYKDQDPFARLELTPAMSLDDDALEQAFRKAQLACHPDRARPSDRDSAEAQFARIVEAYETLKDIKSRATFLFQDRGLWPAPHDAAVLEDLLDLEEAYQAGQITPDALESMLQDAYTQLCTHFDAGHYTDAGSAFLRLNALRRMAGSDSHNTQKGN
jgi:curved DNA-binding protein CbpA